MFPVVDHTALYCVALAVGSVLGAVILSLLLSLIHISEHGTHLVTGAGIHVEPMGIYGGKQDSLAPIEG